MTRVRVGSAASMLLLMILVAACSCRMPVGWPAPSRKIMPWLGLGVSVVMFARCRASELTHKRCPSLLHSATG